ncbi:regulator of chromosome condensation (RCC1) repeat family protein [Carpediemonas membranifera]|uniref:Regulator of chromosome condensation (RCC1) repeat family protein n=1 Tax=Carpediemonas membranifera TaxID=201153 RepID=A0A8J6AZH5_9EUKA|nr:regulator of chromosome condensation (RCC1) repeat family protein [Carpediemonas membranifera]|eukprot:KAG9389717.1 regulator of chromosome condensation (RCC1) repeat family protein [Carpediemonas membranifera]
MWAILTSAAGLCPRKSPMWFLSKTTATPRATPVNDGTASFVSFGGRVFATDNQAPTAITRLPILRVSKIAVSMGLAVGVTEQGIIRFHGTARPSLLKVNKQADVRVDASSVTKLVCDGGCAAVLASGSLFVTGANRDYQLGLGHDRPVDQLVRVDFDDVHDVCLGHDRMALVTSQSKCFVVGSNRRGRLGLGPDVIHARTLTPLGFPIHAAVTAPTCTLFLAQRKIVMLAGDVSHSCIKAYMPGGHNVYVTPAPLQFPWPVLGLYVCPQDGSMVAKRADTQTWYSISAAGLGSGDDGFSGLQWKELSGIDVTEVFEGEMVGSTWVKCKDGSLFAFGHNAGVGLGVGSRQPLVSKPCMVTEPVVLPEPMQLWEMSPGLTPLTVTACLG